MRISVWAELGEVKENGINIRSSYVCPAVPHKTGQVNQ